MELSPWFRYAPRMRKLLFAAIDEAARRGEGEVTAEHLLLGILADRASAAVFLLQYAGADSDRVREELQSRLSAGPRVRGATPQRLSTSARRALDLAAEESEKLRDRHIGTEHLLLGLIAGATGPAGQSLDRFGVTYATASSGMKAWARNAMPRQRAPSRIALLVPFRMRDAIDRAAAPISRWGRLGYDVLVRRSLGHPGYVRNPYPLYRWLREHEPVRKDPTASVWVVTRHADVLSMLRDPRFKRDPFNDGNLPPAVRREVGLRKEPAAVALGVDDADVFSQQMLFLDPPHHTRLRGSFSKAFTPRVVQNLRPRIDQIASALLDRLGNAGQMDVIRDFAYPLPTMVIAELLGFPAEDYERLKVWSDDFAAVLGLNPSAEEQSRAGASLAAMGAYFQENLKQYNAGPKENLISALLASNADGERLTTVELFANCVLLLAAGHETTTNLIGNGLLALLRHPDQLRALRSDPSLAGIAVEELLRFDSPVQWTSRIAGEPLTLGGQTIEAGDFVLASLGAANRDPAVFEFPDRLDIRRADNRHLAFGQGIHFCLGAALARLEGEIAITLLLARFGNIRLASRRLRWRGGVIFRGLKELPISFQLR